MVRNVILFVSTTAVLVLLFVGYVTFVGSPTPDGPAVRSETVELSQATEVAEEKRVRIDTRDGPLDIDPGGAVYYIDYDDLGRTNFIDFTKIKANGYINQLVDNVDKARADYDCSSRPTFIDFTKIKGEGLLNQTAAECSPPIGP